MAEKYAISAQSSGFVSLNGEILDISTYSPTDHVVSIPAGMINIGGQGKGYTIPVTLVYRFTPALTDGTYVIYANAPIDSSGIVTLADDDFPTYIASGGDSDTRRAFCYFRVRQNSVTLNNILEKSSIYTFQGRQVGIPPDPDASGAHITDEVFDKLKKIGFFVNSSIDFGFTYRGQSYDEDVTFEAGVATWDIVYKNRDGTYYRAVADDTLAERAIGIAELDRNGEGSDDNYVMTSGIITVGTTKLPAADFPAGTYIYLTDDVSDPGAIVRDFDFWVNNTSYSSGDRIIGDSDPDSGVDAYIIFEAVQSGSGLSDGNPSNEPLWSTKTTLGDRITDASVTWENVGTHTPNFLNTNRKIRVGISLGDGVMLLQPGSVAGATSIDDHDESAFAHNDIQTAMAKSGVYVINPSLGRNYRNNFAYRGQGFDEQAVFAGGVVNTDLVYRNAAGNYQPAVADDSLAQDLVGMALDVSGTDGTVVTAGFITATTTGFTVGEQLYLSETAAGAFTNVETPVQIGFVILVGDSNNGLILLKPPAEGGGAGDVTFEDLLYHGLLEESFFSHAYYDAFTNFGSPVELGLDGTSPTYVGGTSSYTGVSGDTLDMSSASGFVSGVILDNNTTDYFKFFVHAEADVIFNEVATVVTNADASDEPLADTYFILFAAKDAAKYHVWFNVDAGGTDPNPEPAVSSPIEVAISALDSADTVATAIASAVDTNSNFTSAAVTNTVTITNVANGRTTDIADGGSGSTTGFVFAVTQKGGVIEFSTDGGGVGGNWLEVELDTVRFIPGGFQTLHVRFSWKGTGDLFSYGVLFGESSGILNQTDSRFLSIYEVPQDETANTKVTIPSGNVYTNDGKSLEIYINGAREYVGIDYTETDIFSVTFLHTLNNMDQILFTEKIGAYDASVDNWAAFSLAQTYALFTD